MKDANAGMNWSKCKSQSGGGEGGGSRKEKTTHLMLGYKIWACLG